MDIDKIRNESLTEDSKMEMIADYLKNSGLVGIETLSLDGLSGTLSDDEYAKILKDNCVITVGTQYYYKQYQAATAIRYGATPRLGTNKVIFEYVDIDKDSKAYEAKHEETNA